MSLPTSPTKNDLTTNRLRAIVWGLPGAGKTTWASQWHPSTNLIIDLEGGTRWLDGEHFVTRPRNYSEFMQVVHELTTTQHNFDVVTIDTGDRLTRLADTEAGQRGGKAAAGLVDYGKGLADRDAGVIRDLGKLLDTDMGVILLAHPAQAVNVETGEDIEMLEPRIDPQNRIRQEVVGLFEWSLYIRKTDHMMVTGGDPRVDTKRRYVLPDVIPADPSIFAAELRKSVAAGAVERQPVAA